MPSGNFDLPLIEDNFDGTIRVQYNPKEDGVHEMILLHNGNPVQGNCFSQLLTLLFIFLPAINGFGTQVANLFY